MSEGCCYKCEFFHDNMCKRMENALSSMTDERCIQKCTLMLLNNLGQMVYEYMSEEEDENN
jgi:hypothetical protein